VVALGLGDSVPDALVYVHSADRIGKRGRQARTETSLLDGASGTRIKRGFWYAY